jgi:hypothetical protein
LRQGEIPMPEMLARAEDLEAALAAAIASSPLPETPDRAAVEAWMQRTYRRFGLRTRLGLRRSR